MVLYELGKLQYHVNTRLFHHWQKNSLKAIQKGNSDRVYIVDGMERAGKSTWTFQQMGVLEPALFSNLDKFVKRICFTPEEFFKAVRTVKNGVIIFDEAFRGFSSRAALSKVNKKLIQALMEMGQNNNIVFIVLPAFFLLDTYPAVLRSNGLFNIYLDKKRNRRAWRGYNRRDKNMIYQMGVKRGWSYVKGTAFKGNFPNKFPGGEEYEQAYLKKKSDALRDMDDSTDKDNEFKELFWKKFGMANLIHVIAGIGKLSKKQTVELINKTLAKAETKVVGRTMNDYERICKENKLLLSIDEINTEIKESITKPRGRSLKNPLTAKKSIVQQMVEEESLGIDEKKEEKNEKK